jgi:hypothetical protein
MTGVSESDRIDTERLIKFLLEQADEAASEGLASWFTATADKMESQMHALAKRKG